MNYAFDDIILNVFIYFQQLFQILIEVIINVKLFIY